MKHCVTLLLSLALLSPAAFATTHTVDVNGGADYTEIKPAVTAAAEGDTILIAQGTYTGPENRDIRPYMKNVVIIGDDYGGPVTVDCELEDPGFRFIDGQDATTLLSGVTVVNAANTTNGSAVLITSSSPTIEDCSFLDCQGGSNGGAINMYDSATSISNCLFRGNSAKYRAGAIYAHSSMVTITGCTFDSNTLRVTPTTGGAMYLNDTPALIENCTIVRNDIEQVSLYGPLTDATISNCIIAGGMEGRSVVVGANASGMVTHSLLYQNPGGDEPACGHSENLYEDPRFCSGGVEIYALCEDSSGLPYNNVWLEQIGAHGSGCDPCGSPVEDETWGAVKALFR